ncbi:hypothetical protein PS15m_001860 [Mucor circinelloides]
MMQIAIPFDRNIFCLLDEKKKLTLAYANRLSHGPDSQQAHYLKTSDSMIRRILELQPTRSWKTPLPATTEDQAKTPDLLHHTITTSSIGHHLNAANYIKLSIH